MKSNRLFHTGLYCESLRQLRMMGLVYLLLCLIFAILPPLLAGYSGFYPIHAEEQAATLYVYDFLAPLTMGYALFGYLTRRNASDFYHALPVTREAAYFSRAAAAATYQLITIALTVAVSFLAYGLMGNPVNPVQIPMLITYHFAASALVLSCTLVGLSAAGTYFSSFIVAGIALFLPQMVLYILYSMVELTAPTVYPETITFLLNIPLNIPAGLIAYLFTGGYGLVRDPLSYTLYFPSHLYTLALAVIALLIGCLIHNRCRSETARTAAPNRFLQHLYRSLISLPLFLVIGTMIASQESWGADGESYIILIVVGLLIYFLYELITTRRWHSLIGAAKVLPIVLIVALVLPWLGFGVGHAVNDNVPARDRVASVTLDTDQRHSTNPEHEMIALSRYEYTDEELIDVLHEALSMTVDYYELYGTERVMVTTVPVEQALISPANVYANSGYRVMDVQFNLKGGKSMVRNIRLTPDQYNKVYELRLQDEGFCGIIEDLPTTEQVKGLRIAGYTVPREASLYSGITQDEIWNTFREEYAALDTEAQLMLSNFSERVEYGTYETPIAVDSKYGVYLAGNEFGFGDNYYDSGNTLNVVGFDGLYSFRNTYKVTSLTPKTLVLMMQYVNDKTNEFGAPMSQLVEGLAHIEEDDSLNFYMTLRMYDPEQRYGGAIDMSRSILSEEQMNDPEMAEEIARDLAYSEFPNYVGKEYLDVIEEVFAILSDGSMEITDLNSPIVLMEHVSWDSYKTYIGYSTSPMFFKLDDADFMQLMALLEPYRAQK